MQHLSLFDCPLITDEMYTYWNEHTCLDSNGNDLTAL